MIQFSCYNCVKVIMKQVQFSNTEKFSLSRFIVDSAQLNNSADVAKY